MMLRFRAFSLLIVLWGCGASSSKSTAAKDFTYKLARSYTGLTTNVLSLTFPEDSSYKFAIDGAGFAASVVLGDYLPLQESVELIYSQEGQYRLTLSVVQADDTPFLEDHLTWTYSPRVPSAPIVAFTEAATSDAAVTMTIAANRDIDANEIWVEGDLAEAHAAGGFWDQLSESGFYLLTVTPQDGIKTMQVKLRNIYGNESPSTTASILKKSTRPSECQAILAGKGSAKSTITLQLLANNEGPLFYNIFGDVREVDDFRPFISGDYVDVVLGGGEGVKNLSVVIRDLAGNACDTIQKTVNLASGYVTQSVALEDQVYWTASRNIGLRLTYDHFPDEKPIDMKITGQVTGPNVDRWLPFQEQINIELMPGSGDKRIYAEFRDNTGQESFMVETRVYLLPTLTIATEGGQSRSVIVSRIFGTESYTITGCQEVYDQVAYAASYPCIPLAEMITVLHQFEDGTDLSLSAKP